MNKIQCISIVFAITYIWIGNAHCDNEWANLLKENFDVVDTFDDYNDWKPIHEDTECAQDPDPEEENVPWLGGPIYKNGADSKWDYNCYRFGGANPIEKRKMVITDPGPDKRVTGKAVAIGYPIDRRVDTYKGHDGVHKFQRYFGNGKPDSGYKEMYCFFRLYLPSTMFPTVGENGMDWDMAAGGNPVVRHEKGHRFAYLSSFKWLNFGTGFLNARDWYNQKDKSVNDTWDAAYTYGDTENWIHLEPETVSSQYKIRAILQQWQGSPTNKYHIKVGKSIEPYLDYLAGFEMYIKIESPAGPMPGNEPHGNGVCKIWMYDKGANKNLILEDTKVAWRTSGQDGSLINKIWFQGNNRLFQDNIYYLCGDGMDCAWWVDDLIIDDQPIGVKYYQLLGYDTQQVPLPVDNLRIE